MEHKITLVFVIDIKCNFSIILFFLNYHFQVEIHFQFFFKREYFTKYFDSNMMIKTFSPDFFFVSHEHSFYTTKLLIFISDWLTFLFFLPCFISENILCLCKILSFLGIHKTNMAKKNPRNERKYANLTVCWCSNLFVYLPVKPSLGQRKIKDIYLPW